jgi:diguanylate cyclase (GGDEF)-like protein
VAVALADVDRFKAINDVYGHPIGDEVLVELADRLRASMRAGETVARWGGEEFLVVLPGADAEGARLLADRLRRIIASHAISTHGGPLMTTLSWGVAAVTAPPDDCAGELIRCADSALYAAKAHGRNRVEAIFPQPAHGSLASPLAALISGGVQ